MSELLERLSELEIQLNAAKARNLELETRLQNSTIQNEQRYRSIVEDQTELICRYNPDFILTYVNRAYSAHFGLSPADMIGTNFLSFIPDEDSTAAVELIHNLSAANPVSISEHRATLPDGSVRWMQWTDRAILDAKGNILEYQGVARDITERKNFQAEQERNTTAIEEMRQFLQSTLDVLSSNIAVLAPDGTILKVNAAWERFARENGNSTMLAEVGVNYLTVCDEAIGEFSQESAPMAAGIRAVVRGEGDSFYLEYPCNVGDKQFWFGTNVTPFTESVPRRVVVAHTDITERKQAQENFNSLNALLAQSRDLVATSDLDGNINYMNAGGIAMLGYAYPELALQANISTLHSTEDTQKVLEEYIPIAIQTGQWRGENRVKTCNGEIIEVDQTVFAINDTLGKVKSYATIMIDITEHKRALKALRDSEEKYRSLIESSSASITMVNKTGAILFANKIAAQRFGTSTGEVNGKTVFDVLDPVDAASRLKNIQKVINDGVGTEFEFSAVLGGETRWFQVSIQPVFDTFGNAYAAMINSNDITTTKKAEEALRQSEARQRAMLSAIPDLMFRTAADGTFLDYHTPSIDLLATPPELFLGKKPQDVLPPELAQRQIEASQEVIRTHQMVQYDYSMDLHGETREFEARLAPVNNNEVLAIVRDVTERKHAIDALKISEEKYRSLIESSDSVIALVNRDGYFLFANKIAAQQLRLTPDTLVGRHMTEVFPPEAVALQMRHLVEVIDSGQGQITEASTIVLGETRWYRTSMQPVRDNSGTPFAALVNSSDITNIKVAEAARRESDELFQHLMKHLPGTVAIHDQHNKLKFCNDLYAKVIGRPTEELMGKDIQSYLPPDVYPLAAEENKQIFSQMKVMEINYKGPDAKHWLIIKFPIPRQNLPPLIGTISVDVTKEKEAEEVLQKAHDRLEQRVIERTAELEGTKNRLEAIFNYSSDAILLLNINHGVQQANHTFEKMFGFEHATYECHPLAELIQPEDTDKLNASILEIAKTHEASQLETLTRRQDGTLFEAEISLAPIKHSLQPISNLVCIIRDITERKKAQMAIAEERNLLRTLIDAIPDFIYIKDTQHRIILNNVAHARSVGNKTPVEVVGKTDFELFPLEMATKFYEDEVTLFKTQQPLITVEETSIGIDGDIIWASTSKIPLRNLAGEVTGLVGITHDITKIKASEEALRHSEEKLRESQQILLQVLDTIPVRVFWKDRDSIYLGCNRLFADDAGLDSTSDIIGKSDADLGWSSDDTTAYVLDDLAVIESGVAKLEYEESQTTAKGTKLILQTSKLPLRDVQGAVVGVLGAYIDITARKATEEALQRNQADLESIIESTSLGFVLYDLEGNIRIVNHLAQKYTMEQYGILLEPGHSMLEYIPAEGHPLFHERFRKVRAGESLNFVNVVKNGSKTIYFEFRYYPVKTSAGAIIGVSLAFEDITRRKENELQLGYLASLQENMLEAVITTDLKFNIKSWNKAAEAIYGWSAADAIGKSLRTIISSNIVSGGNIAEATITLMEKGFWSGEAVQIRRDGSEVNVLSSIVLLRDSEGNPTGVVGVNHDITDRKQAEIVLEEKRRQELELQQYLKDLHEISVELTAIPQLDEFYRKVVEFGLARLGFERLGFFICDPNDNLAIGTYGTDAQGKLVSEHDIKLDLTTLTGRFKKAMHYPDRYIFEEDVRLFSGEEFIGVGWNAVVGLWNGSELLGWLAIDNAVHNKPVTRNNLEVLSLYRMTVAALLSNKLVEEKLQTTSQRLKLATQTGGIGIWDWDLKDNSLVWDDQMFALYGTTRESFTGNYNDWVAKFLHPDDLNLVQTAVTNALSTDKPYEIEFRVFWPNGSLHYIKSNTLSLRNEDGQPVRMIGVNWDLTNLKRGEEALKEALKKEKELGELKTRFVSRASHEFRTPLAAILATTETLSIYRPRMNDTQVDARLNKIRQQVVYMTGIMEDVLQLSRLQSGRLEFHPAEGDLDELCQSIISEFESQAENKNRIVYTATNSPLFATYDSRLIRQVISNLTSNALKYSPAEKPIYLELSKDNARYILKVRDEGIGIPAEDLKNLFEPFQRASNVGTIAGTGLGLSIALQAVDMHGGTISVESELDKGTTFTLTLP